MMIEGGYKSIGWECPKCGRCYSPTMSECYVCNNQIIIATKDTTEIKPISDSFITVTCPKCGQTMAHNTLCPTCYPFSTHVATNEDKKNE